MTHKVGASDALDDSILGGLVLQHDLISLLADELRRLLLKEVIVIRKALR